MYVRRGTQIGRVRGMGSAQGGTHHWWMQRATAISNLLLMVWFWVSLLRLPQLDHFNVTQWISQPLVAVPLALLPLSFFWHLRLGVQVMIEDYVHSGARFACMLALNAFFVVGIALSIFSILSIAL